jgi:tetratricopeptide (TPR) repeat protein
VQIFTVVALVALTVSALVRWPALGFVGAWFFLILAPSSSIVPLLDSIFEHRVYLSLAAPLGLAVLALWRCAGWRAAPALGVAALACMALTIARNRVYQDAASIWSQAIAYRPDNPRAHFELGNVLLARQRPAEAIERYRAAIRLQPDYLEARNNLGAALLQSGQGKEALAEFEALLRLRPLPNAHFAAGRASAELGLHADAVRHYTAVLQMQPDHLDALNNRANLRLQGGDAAGAIADYQAALRVAPAWPEARYNLAVALLALGRNADAITELELALRLRPAFPEATALLAKARGR